MHFIQVIRVLRVFREALVAALLLCVCVTGYARSIPGAANEVIDPWFEDLSGGWYIESTASATIADNPGNLPGGYFDPGRSPGDVAFLRTIVDDYKGLWDPSMNMKEIDLSLFCHVVGGGYIKVRFDWWYDPGIDMPPFDPSMGIPPDGYSDWYTMTAGSLGDFSDGVDYLRDDESPGFFTPDGSESWLLNIHEIWDYQPRWVSIEIEVGIDQSSAIGGEALITGIDFEAQCVPEPMTLTILLAGAAAILRRKR